jgi:hypothetical protein
MGVCGQSHSPAALPPRKGRGTHYTGGWVGPTSRRVWKISPTQGFDPRFFQSLASYYTDYAIIYIFIYWYEIWHRK